MNQKLAAFFARLIGITLILLSGKDFFRSPQQPIPTFVVAGVGCLVLALSPLIGRMLGRAAK